MSIEPTDIFFYRVYIWALRRNGQEDVPHVTALCMMGILIWLNILTILSVVEIFTGINFDKDFHISRVCSFVFAIIIYIFLHFVFLKNRKYKQIVTEFKGENHTKRIKGAILVWCYIVGTVMALMLFSYIAKQAMDSNFTIIGYVHSLFIK